MYNEIFDEYLRETEPKKKEKGYAWSTAIGLQSVDGLETSDYLLSTAKKHIEGDISFQEADERIQSYYQENSIHTGGPRTEEADKVSLRIAQLLSERAFVFSPAQYLSIHAQLFSGIYRHAGQLRDYNITKSEWVLDGDTVIYGSALSLRQTLEYDFSVEREFRYQSLTMEQIIAHLAQFVSRLWQIHVFGEGNTRTTAVFFIKYLRSLGFDVTNETFAENAWYFRNALVRANYTNLQKGIHETTEFLELFLRNLLLGEKNPLKNRHLHISGDFDAPKCKEEGENCTLDCTLEEVGLLNLLRENPRLTQKQLSQQLEKSERTVKTLTASLEKKGIITRVNGKRFGHWRVNEI